MNRTTPTARRPAPRPYSSSLRERQVEQTRELIFQALMEELVQEGFQEFNIPRLARRAGVSIRTVYRYFPTRDALLDAFDVWMDDRIVEFPPPKTADEIADLAERTFPAFDEHEQIMLAQWATPPGRDVRARGRRRRVKAYAAALRDVTDNLDAGEAGAALGVVSYLMSSLTWKTLKEEFALDGKQSGTAVAWALRTLIADLKRKNTEALNRQTEP